MALPQLPNRLKIGSRRRCAEQIPTPAVAARGKEFHVIAPEAMREKYGRTYAGGVGTDKNGRNVFAVPLDDKPASVAIRAHEYAHLSTDSELPDLVKIHDAAPDMWVQPVLDNFVNSYARAKGVNEVADLPLPGMELSGIPEADRMVRGVNLLQRLSVDPKQRVKHVTKEDSLAIRNASKRIQQLGTALANGKSTMGMVDELCAVAKSLATRYLTPPDPPKAKPSGTPGKPGKGDGDKPGKPSGSFPGGGAPTILSGRPDYQSLQYLINQANVVQAKSRYGYTDVEWCPMQTVPKLLDRSMPRKHIAPKRRPGFAGAFRNPLRALLPAYDGMAWSVKLKREGGTILLDLSGSMSIKPAQILELLKRAPHATVAMYCSDCETGYFQILARNGRYTSCPESLGSGNGCDGPALRWLALQQGPKVWISDGCVTGIRDDSTPQLAKECLGIVADHDIYMCGNLPTFFAASTVEV